MTTWTEAVFHTQSVVVHEGLLVLYDEAADCLKAYDISAGIENPVFRWQAAKRGNGPGEMAGTGAVRHLSVNPADGSFWISHQQGFHIVDRDGQFVTTIPMTYNRAWLQPLGHKLFLTSPNPWRDRGAAVRALERKAKDTLWTFAYANDIPVLPDERFLEPAPALFLRGNALVFTDGSVGKVVRLGMDGSLVWSVRLPFPRPDRLQVVDHDLPKPRATLRTRGWSFPTGGNQRIGNDLYVVTRCRAAGATTVSGQTIEPKHGLRSLLHVVDFETGQLQQRLLHPVFENSLYFFHQEEGSFWFLDMEAGDRLHIVTRNRFQLLERFIFDD